MWKFTAKSITETLRFRKNDDPKPGKPPPDSSGDGTLLRTTREERLECPICWESFNVVENVPYVMWCGHTICKYCLVGLQRAIVKFPPLPFQLPFFVACPWCNFLSLRLVYNGIIKFPSKNYYLLWMVESMTGYRSKSCREEDTPSLCGHIDTNEKSEPTDTIPDELSLNNRSGWHWIVEICSTGRLHDSFLLGLYIFLTFALAVPSLLVLNFAFPSLNWLIREMAA